LSRLGLDHVVLEKGRIGQTWRDRWDSFCLVTPNWTVQLPGYHYDGDDPDGYMPRDDIVGYLERYATSFEAPVREGVEVRALTLGRAGDFVLESSGEPIRARQVVLATGAYQRPHRPAGAASLPADVFAIDVEDYRNPDSLPAGSVLIVGSGQSGCQLAEELTDAGRQVVLACGRAPWFTRRVDGKDVVWWVIETGFWKAPLSSLSSPQARLFANILATGHGGGHDMHLRTLQAQGIQLTGRFLGVEDGRAYFAGDLEESVAWGDARYHDFASLIRKTATEKSLAIPDMPPPAPFFNQSLETLAVRDIGAVIFAGGFRPDYSRWVRLESAFDGMGFPVQVDGASGVYPGLYFVGVHFLRTRESSLLHGVGEDAAVVARTIAERSAAIIT
jgi:putative flavoprotein involved in K+ transport